MAEMNLLTRSRTRAAKDHLGVICHLGTSGENRHYPLGWPLSRDYDPDDTLRFYALRLHEAGLIRSSPNKLIADHTDWRFLDEVKRELKA